MEVRALLAIVLSMLVLTVYQYFFVPPPVLEAPPETGPTEQGIPAPAPEPVTSEPVATPPPAVAAAGTLAAEGAATPETLRVRGDGYQAEITNIGGRLESFVLTDYTDPWGDPLDLVNPGARAAGTLPLGLVTPGQPESGAAANSALYTLAVAGGRQNGRTRAATPSSPVVVTLTWADGLGATARKQLTFPAEGNQIQVAVEASFPGSPAVYLTAGTGLNATDRSARQVFLREGAIALSGDELKSWAPDDLGGPVTSNGETVWAGLESYYFLSAFVVESASDLLLSSETVSDWPVADPPTTVDLVNLSVRVPVAGLSADIYLGPKKYDYLLTQGHELERVVDFGWLAIIARPLLALLNWIQSYVGNYGIAIILLTVLLRIAFWPLNHKAMVSMRKTQSLQPQMAAIRAKYKGAKELDQRQKMNEEVMALYRKEGVSPLGGCLPMIAQLPILFSFYRLLSIAIELRGAPFALWIQDLSRYDPYIVLPILMGASMIVQQRMTPSAGANPTQARMMRLMPIMFTVLFLWVPSGLVLYWTSNNILGIGQQVYINRQIDRDTQARKDERKRGKKSQRGKR